VPIIAPNRLLTIESCDIISTAFGFNAIRAVSGVGMPASSVSNVSKKIGKLLELMDQGQLVLPEMQRDFVWTRKSIKLLIDSLYRGLPIGHMLIWKAETAIETKSFDKRPLKRGARLEGFYGYLLDGQQRLTALSHLRDGDEDYPLMFYIWPERTSEGDETLYWRGKNEKDNAWCIPMGDALSDNFNVTERMNAIRANEFFKREHEDAIYRDLSALQGIRSYEVGITEFETDDYRLATELFVRFNSTGRKLKRSDLSIAELAIHVPGLASKAIRRAQNRWKDFRFTMPFLVQCLLAVHTGRFRLTDPENFWATTNPSDLVKTWEQTERALSKLVEFLTGTVRWTSASLIPSFNALIPLVVVLARNNNWSLEDKRLARKWLLLASIHGYFSGSTQTQLDKLLRKIEAKPTIRQLWMVTSRTLRRLRAEDFMTGRVSGAAMSCFLSMLRDRDARDWQNNGPLDGTVVGHGAALQIHHFFPKALLNKHGMTRSEVNTFGNYTVIHASTNLNVSTEEPGTYLERLNVPKSELNKQVIPLKPELWRVARYKDFLTQRRRLLAEQMNNFLDS
jgi:hypothetical protein